MAKQKVHDTAATSREAAPPESVTQDRGSAIGLEPDCQESHGITDIVALLIARCCARQLGVGRRRVQGKVDGKASPTAVWRLDMDLAPVPLDDPVGE